MQGGNIVPAAVTEPPSPSSLGKYGVSASGEPFIQENFRILHSYKDAGVLSMMKDIRNGNKQDSRFFITTEPAADWADGKYVAFGRVSSGMNFIRGLTVIPVEPPSNFPKTRIKIVDSGVIGQ